MVKHGVRGGILPEGTAPLRVLGRQRLFHLCAPDAAHALLDEPPSSCVPIRPASLEEEGFVHLSEQHQLPGTLDAHFGGAQALCLLELDADRVGPKVDWEPSRGGESFPHLYREIESADVLHRWSMECEPGQALEVPSLGPPAP